PSTNRILAIEATQPAYRVPQLRDGFVRRDTRKDARRPGGRGGGNDGPVRLIARNLFSKPAHGARGRLLDGTDDVGILVLEQVRIVRVHRYDRITRRGVLD